MNAIDSFFTLVWMVCTFAIPRTALFLRSRRDPDSQHLLQERELISGVDEDTETVHPLDLAILITMTAGAVWFARLVSQKSADALTALLSDWELTIDSRGMFYILLTTIALGIAQLPGAKRLIRGSQLFGMFAMYLFLATKNKKYLPCKNFVVRSHLSRTGICVWPFSWSHFSPHFWDLHFWALHFWDLGQGLRRATSPDSVSNTWKTCTFLQTRL